MMSSNSAQRPSIISLRRRPSDFDPRQLMEWLTGNGQHDSKGEKPREIDQKNPNKHENR